MTTLVKGQYEVWEGECLMIITFKTSGARKDFFDRFENAIKAQEIIKKEKGDSLELRAPMTKIPDFMLFNSYGNCNSGLEINWVA